MEQLDKLVTELNELHVHLTQSASILRQLQMPPAFKDSVRGWQDVVKDLITGWPDYSIMNPEDRKSVKELYEVLLLRQPFETSSSEAGDQNAFGNTVIRMLNSLTSSVQEKLIAIKASKDRGLPTPLLEHITGVWESFHSIDENYQSELKGNIFFSARHRDLLRQVKAKANPKGALTLRPVTYHPEGVDDLGVPIPLVHPNQCEMEMRLADASYFAEERDTAAKCYANLRERLCFVPALLRNFHESQSKGASRSPLLQGFLDLQDRDKLSFWTFDTLSYVYNQVCSKLYLLSMKTSRRDLFDFSENLAPRLSAQFYINYATQQTERLRVFENSYWLYFEDYQKQMEAGFVLRGTMAANVYRRKETVEGLSHLIRTMKDKEQCIENAATGIEKQRLKLVEDLSKVEGALKKLHAPSAASVFTALSSCVIAGIAIASGPVGWVAGAALVAAVVGPQAVSLWDEASNTVEDGAGQRVNKKYLINRLDRCEDSLQSLMNRPAYNMEADGTKLIGEEDSAKIAVTKEQLEQFLQQFHDAVGSDALSKSLKAFIAATNARNQDILAYNHAVAQCYTQLKQQTLLEAQASEISSQLIKENTGLPSIVAYYQRVRLLSRMSILRTIKLSALALRYSRLIEPIKFSTTLLSNIDELDAHIDVLMKAHEATSSNLGTLAQTSWPALPDKIGILWPLTQEEVAALKIGVLDPRIDQGKQGGSKVYSVCIESLAKSATSTSTINDTPFAGLANVRVSQVRVWVPNLQLKGAARRDRVSVEIKQEGSETVTSPDNVISQFQHDPVYLTFQYRWDQIKQAVDIHSSHVTSTHILASDWEDANTNTRIQAPIGPFANWVITLRDRDNGQLDLSAVKKVFLEFHGSGFPFRE